MNELLTWSMPIPSRWTWVEDPDVGIFMHGRCPVPDSAGHHATITVAAARHSIRDDPCGSVLEDEEDVHLGSGLAIRRRLSFLSEGHELIREQWTWPGTDLSVMLRCTAGPEDYAKLAELFETMAAGFRFESPGWADFLPQVRVGAPGVSERRSGGRASA